MRSATFETAGLSKGHHYRVMEYFKTSCFTKYNYHVSSLRIVSVKLRKQAWPRFGAFAHFKELKFRLHGLFAIL